MWYLQNTFYTSRFRMNTLMSQQERLKTAIFKDTLLGYSGLNFVPSLFASEQVLKEFHPWRCSIDVMRFGNVNKTEPAAWIHFFFFFLLVFRGKHDFPGLLYMKRFPEPSSRACARARSVALFQLFCMSNDFPPRVVSAWQRVSETWIFSYSHGFKGAPSIGTWLAIFVMILSLWTWKLTQKDAMERRIAHGGWLGVSPQSWGAGVGGVGGGTISAKFSVLLRF